MMNRLILTLFLLLSIGAVHAESFRISGVTTNGGTVLRDEVSALTAPLIGKRAHIEDLVAVINAINKLYADNGYINSGARLPDQDLASGNLTIDIIEGRLSGVTVSNSGRISESRIQSIIQREAAGVLRIDNLQRAFSELERWNVVDAVQGRVVPSQQQGEARLDVSVVEADAFSVRVAANNYRSPSLGSDQGQVSLRHINLTGHGDELFIAGDFADGVDSGTISYAFPVPAWNMRVSAYYAMGDSTVVEEPFDQIDIEAETDTAGFNLDFDLVDNEKTTISLGAGLEVKESTTTLLGQPFDFSPGSIDGESKAAIAAVRLGYERRTRQNAFAARLTYRKGLDALDATVIPGLPDGEFSVTQLQASYVQRFALGSNEVLWHNRFNSQFTSDTLQAFERFALGGHNSVRGFRENQVLRDEAWEFRSQLDVPVWRSSSGDVSLTMLGFLDAGEGENTLLVPNTPQSVDLSSIGVGFRFLWGGLTFLFEYGERLSEEQELGDELQDKGIHVGVSYEF